MHSFSWLKDYSRHAEANDLTFQYSNCGTKQGVTPIKVTDIRFDVQIAAENAYLKLGSEAQDSRGYGMVGHSRLMRFQKEFMAEAWLRVPSTSAKQWPLLSRDSLNKGGIFEARTEYHRAAIPELGKPNNDSFADYDIAKLSTVAIMPKQPLPVTSPAAAKKCMYSKDGADSQQSCETHLLPTTPTNKLECADEQEGETLEIQCAVGHVVKSIEFSSFGQPQGRCKDIWKVDTAQRNDGNFVSSFGLSECHARTSRLVVEELCLGKPKCVIEASRTNFGDPCAGHSKRLLVQLTCGTQTLLLDTPGATMKQVMPAPVQVACPAGSVIGAVPFAGYGELRPSRFQMSQNVKCEETPVLAVPDDYYKTHLAVPGLPKPNPKPSLT